MLNYCHKLWLNLSKFFARFKTIDKIAKQRPLITSVISVCILGLATWGLVALFNSPKCPQVGDRAPDITLRTVEGKEVRISDFRGEIIILYLYSITDCGYCVYDMPYIQAIFDKWGKQNLAVLAVDVHSTPDEIKDFITNKGLTIPFFTDSEAKSMERFCLGWGVPVTIFIDSKGIIKEKEIGGWAIRNDNNKQAILSEIGSILNEMDNSQKFDWTPPIISNISVSSVTESSAIISWTTDEPATSEVRLDNCCYDPLIYDCGLTECASVSPSPLAEDKQTLVNDHYLIVNGLFPDLKYYITVYSNDASGNEATSIGGTFTTRPAVVCSKINCIAPNFTLQSIDGKTINLDDLKGKKILLNFWISTCGACDSETGYIQEIYRKYPKNEIAILVVNVREDAFVVSSYAQREGLSFTILLDSEGRVDQIYQPELFPCTFFIGTDGTIQAIKSEAFTSVDEIQSILDGMD